MRVPHTKGLVAQQASHAGPSMHGYRCRTVVLTLVLNVVLVGVAVVNSPLSPLWVTLVSSSVTAVVALLGSRIVQPGIHPVRNLGDNSEQALHTR